MGNLLTKAGLDRFKEEQARLLQKRKETLVNLVRAREMGDLSENGAYKGSRSELSSIDRRLREIEFITKGAEIISSSLSDTVQLGSKVSLLSSGKNIEYTVVGKFETNPKEGRISDESMLGRSLLGKKQGEEVEVNLPGGTTSYKILSVR